MSTVSLTIRDTRAGSVVTPSGIQGVAAGIDCQLPDSRAMCWVGPPYIGQRGELRIAPGDVVAELSLNVAARWCLGQAEFGCHRTRDIG